MARVSPAHHNQRHKKYPGGVFFIGKSSLPQVRKLILKNL